MAVDKARFAGEPVATVVAEDRATAAVVTAEYVKHLSEFPTLTY